MEQVNHPISKSLHGVMMVTPQVRHPERVFLREGSPSNGTVSKLCRIQEILHCALDDVPWELLMMLTVAILSFS
jgi:hypothetical protein